MSVAWTSGKCLAVVVVLLTVFARTESCLRLRTRSDIIGESTAATSEENGPPAGEAPAYRKVKGSPSLSRIGVRGRWLVDGYGRVRLFHGWNSVQKGAPWYTEEARNETKLDLYRDWGFNVVRLGCMWSGFEPEENRYNESYVAVLRDIVRRLARRGIYVILDMHQDLMSTEFGNYDGIPLWIVDKFPPSPHRYPWPLRRDRFQTWTDGYLSQAVGLAFQHLYDNYGHALDMMARFWTRVADAFRDSPNVLGYELINEPWAGDIYGRPSLLKPGVAGAANLLPSYDRISRAIRIVDDRTPIFYEPVTWGVFLNGDRLGSGFDRVPGGPEYADRSVLAYHYYCWLMDVSAQHRPLTFLQRTICDKIVGPDVFPTVLRDIQRTNGSSFLTEFGACEPDGQANSSATVECHFVMDLADRYLASWTYWDHAFFDERGRVNWNVASSFARVYSRAVSGIPKSMSYSPTDFSFWFSYQPDLTINQPTEIVIPSLHYRHGFRVSTSAGVKWSFDEKERILKVYAGNNTEQALVTVRIKPKKPAGNQLNQMRNHLYRKVK